MPEWITQLITLIPIAAIIWKGALMAGEIKQLRKDVDTNHQKLNNFRDNELGGFKQQLTEIIVRLTRIETTLEAGNGKRKHRDTE